MLFSWLKNRRRQKLLQTPFPDAWNQALTHNVHHDALLPAPQRQKLRRLVTVFIAEKRWEGCGGLELNDEIQVTIAAQACLLAVGVEPDYFFDRVQTILVYPAAYMRVATWEHEVPFGSEPTLGEAWQHGPIIISWRDALEAGRNPHSGQNVVVHEFAHYLDALDGSTDGIPPLPSRKQYQDWQRVTDEEYHRLVRSRLRGEVTLLDQYGASNKAEFFAVATECFFQRPKPLERRHPALYKILSDFYHQDPASWRLADPARVILPSRRR